MGYSLDAMCRRVPAMGLKSIRELREILTKFSERSEDNTLGVDCSPDGPIYDPNNSTAKQDLLQRLAILFSNVSLSETIETIGSSVRLAHGIERAPLRNAPLGQLLLNWGQTCSSLRQVKNVGWSSLQELREICSGLIGAYLVAHGFDDHDCAPLCALPFGGGPATSDDYAPLVGKLSTLPEFNFSMLRSGEILAPHPLADILLRDLDDRSCEIVVRRYGLRGDVSETLEQIAEGYGLTRERIRQLESKALKKMARKGAKFPLWESLIGYGAEIWKTLVGEDDFLRIADISNKLAIAPCIRMLMDVQGISTPDLLDRIATKWRDGWCRTNLDRIALDRAKAELGSVLSGKSLPRPIPLLASGENQEIARIAAEIGLGLKTYRGYVLSKEVTTRSQTRLVDLHRLVGDSRLPCSAAKLAMKFVGVQQVGSASARYVTMVMERHPHLFLEADDGQWFGIGGHYSADLEATAFLSEPVQNLDDAGDDAFTTAGLLREILLEEGPTKLSHLVEIAAGRLPPDRSIASVGPTLIMNPEYFVRVLPGVYGLKGNVPADRVLFEQSPAYLLNDEQARYYAMGRRAGEPWGTFPLWSPAAEAALCSWALHNADGAILQSLVSVAAFDSWPVDEGTKQAWKDFATSRPARFRLHFLPREEAGYALPKLDRLLAACLEARAKRQFNWMVGNRILKRPVYSHMSAGLVALMCSLDVLKIEQDGHWQLPHSCGSNLEDLILLLSSKLHDDGALDWGSPLGARILAQAGDAIGRWSGWVDRQLLARMLTSPSTVSGHGGPGAIDLIGKAVEAEINDLKWTTAEEALEPSQPFDGQGLIGYSALEVTSARVLSGDEGEWSFEDDFTD